MRTKWNGRTTLIVLISLLQAVICKDLLETLEDMKAESFLALASIANLKDALKNNGNGSQLTLFVPSEDALKKLPKYLSSDLMEHPDELHALLLSHMVDGKAMSDQIVNDEVLMSKLGSKIRTNVYLKSDFYQGFITINGKRLMAKDIEADNGVIHVLADLMYPIPEGNLAEVLRHRSDQFSLLYKALEKADLVETLETEGPFTLFAPIDEAFESIPKEDLDALLNDEEKLPATLLRHVLPGVTIVKKGITWKIHDSAGGEQFQTQVFKGGIIKVVSLEGMAKIIDHEIVGNNGVIHVIDSII